MMGNANNLPQLPSTWRKGDSITADKLNESVTALRSITGGVALPRTTTQSFKRRKSGAVKSFFPWLRTPCLIREADDVPIDDVGWRVRMVWIVLMEMRSYPGGGFRWWVPDAAWDRGMGMKFSRASGNLFFISNSFTGWHSDFTRPYMSFAMRMPTDPLLIESGLAVEGQTVYRVVTR